MNDWTKSDASASHFWVQYVMAARAGYGQPFDDTDEMRVAINEWFSKIDKAAASGCIYFSCRQRMKEPRVIRLLFSDGKDKR